MSESHEPSLSPFPLAGEGRGEGKSFEIASPSVHNDQNTNLDNSHEHRFTYSFELASYDKTHPLIIDPALAYSTYLGGSGGEFGWGIAVDVLGNAYVTGETGSANFPTASPVQEVFGGGSIDAFVMKFNAAGTALIYSTYLGGSDADSGNGIAVDAFGNAYVVGTTYSTNFPTAIPVQGVFGGVWDAFVTKFDSAGIGLIYSTYLGGSGDDKGRGIAVDALGNTYVTGDTSSSNFPTVGPLQSSIGGSSDAFVVELSSPSAVICSRTAGLPGSTSFFTIDVPGSINSIASGINDCGHIVGDVYDQYGYHGYVFDGSVFAILDFPGAPFTRVTGINNSGQIAGYFNPNGNQVLGSGSFVYQNGVYTNLVGICNVPNVLAIFL